MIFNKPLSIFIIRVKLFFINRIETGKRVRLAGDLMQRKLGDGFVRS
jgi:hypothetical protein